MKENFERRIIAYVDVLGFSNIVERMASDHRLYEIIRDALKLLNEQSKEFDRYRRGRREKRKDLRLDGAASLPRKTDFRMTAFSDCYVLSEIDHSWHVLAAVQSLASRFLTEGILTRGGIIIGEAYHRESILFGPGIVKAYKMESETAVYPRILVSDDVIKDVWSYHEGLWRGRLLTRDEDGRWFVNLLVPSLSSWAPISVRPSNVSEQDSEEATKKNSAHLSAVHKSLRQAWLDAAGNKSYEAKVSWLIRHFNKTAEKHRVERLNPKLV